MKLTKEEKAILDEHIIYQKEIRKIDQSLKDKPEFQDYVELIIENSLFKLFEFLYKNNLTKDKEKLDLCWKYLKKRL